MLNRNMNKVAITASWSGVLIITRKSGDFFFEFKLRLSIGKVLKVV